MYTSNQETRVESDSMGEVRIPESAIYGPQTQRAINNFPISGLIMPREFIRALGLIKSAAAYVNEDLNLLSSDMAQSIQRAADAVAKGDVDSQFKIALLYMA